MSRRTQSKPMLLKRAIKLEKRALQLKRACQRTQQLVRHLSSDKKCAPRGVFIPKIKKHVEDLKTLVDELDQVDAAWRKA